jgi:hypothetical protein
MTAVAEIKKKPQQPQSKKLKRSDGGKNRHDVIIAGRGKSGRLTREEDPVRHEQAIQVYLEWVRNHHKAATAYFKVWPEKRRTMKTATASRLAMREIAYAKSQGFDRDVIAAYIANGLTAPRLALENEKRLNANTLKDIVKSEIIRPRGIKGMLAKEPFVLTMRQTIEVEDNSTRMRATELLADVHGARKIPAGGEVQQNVGIIYVVGGKIMKKRQERIT